MGLGIRIKIWIVNWDWRFGQGIEIGDQGWGLVGVGDWLGLGIEDWGLVLGIGDWD